MKNRRPFIPGFINKLDRWLMLNMPDIWTTRTHFVLYYGLLFSILVAAVCFVMPDDPHQASAVYMPMLCVALLSAMGFIGWLIFLLRFNVFKRFGTIKKGSSPIVFLIYFVVTGLMVSVIFIPLIVESVKANIAFSDEEMTQDINSINLAICRLNIDSMPRKWTADTTLVRIYPESTIFSYEGAVEVPDTLPKNEHFRVSYVEDDSNLQNWADSIIKINDTVLILFRGAPYDFLRVSGYNGQYAYLRQSKTHLLNSAGIFSKVFNEPDTTDKKKLQVQLKQLLDKYNIRRETSIGIGIYPSGNHSSYEDSISDYTGYIMPKYGLYDVQKNVNNIVWRKWSWRWDLPELLRLVYYPALMLALFVFIFRHSTLSTFFLSLVAGIILLLLTILLLKMAKVNQAGEYAAGVFYFFLFLGVAIRIRYSKIRGTVKGIALNLSVFSTAFMPVLVILFYYQVQQPDSGYFRKFKNEEWHYLYAEIIGFVLLLVLIETIYKKLYRTWYALPEQ